MFARFKLAMAALT